ncbi:MAG: hypothetical protein RLZZ562_3020 [Planctomycetota bacterium]|jgi:hypothetical protein
MKIAFAVVLTSALLAAQQPKPEPAPQPVPKTEQKKPEEQKPEAKPADGKQEPKPAPQEQPAQEPRIDQPAPDQPMPAGSDPADLAAMRSAEAMLAAERRLQQMIKEGKIEGLDKIVTFDELSAWPYEDGLKGMPKKVKDLHGKKVLMSGFMLPIDEVRDIKEFLLVQSLWSCCYGQPPDINGIVRVVMPKGKTTDYFFDPLKIIGTFKVEATSIDNYCVDIYQIEVESLEALKEPATPSDPSPTPAPVTPPGK